jgi:nitrile hydratase accessory protein
MIRYSPSRGRPAVVALHQRGLLSWPEWSAALADEIAASGDDAPDQYYHHWLAALERLLAKKSLADPVEQRRYRAAWDHAADRTPHGQPVELTTGDFG